MDRILESNISSQGNVFDNESILHSGSLLTLEQQHMINNNHYVMASDQIRLYGSVILIPTGIILNILSFVIFYKIKKYKSAPSSHIMCMAIADNCALLGITAMENYSFTEDHWIPSIQDLNLVLCKGSTFIVNAGALWSGVLLASATVERYFCIAFPLKVKSWNFNRISKILNITYFFTSFALNIPAGYDLYMDTAYNETVCIFPLGGVTEVSDLVINGVLSHIIITMIILIFTVAIAVCLKKTRDNRKTLSQSVVIQRSKEFVITTMLFAIACLFLVTRLPIVIVFEASRYLETTDNFDLRSWQLFWVVWNTAVLLLVINHSTNFVIYMIFFKEFRDKFVAMVTCKREERITTLRRSSTRTSMVI